MRVYIFYIIIPLLFFSCSSEEKTDQIGIGSITGTVKLFTSRGGHSPNDNMRVSIEGTSPLITILTDQNGSYRFDNLPYGRYDLQFEKEGFGTFIRGNILHQQEETAIVAFETLGEKSTTEINQLQLFETDTGITLSIVTSPPAHTANIRYIRVFFNIGSEASNHIFGYFTPILQAEFTPFIQHYTFDEFEDLGFISGATIHIKAYGESLLSNEYNDPNNGDFIFPNLNSNTTSGVSFIMP
ncbi:MAG: hypothetical protein ACI9Y7_002299 [Dokdonia sp.]|jgi:hypothetical protein